MYINAERIIKTCAFTIKTFKANIYVHFNMAKKDFANYIMLISKARALHYTASNAREYSNVYIAQFCYVHRNDFIYMHACTIFPLCKLTHRDESRILNIIILFSIIT